MAEQQGFFRRIFSFGSTPQVDRSAERENLVAAPDIAAKRPESPDADTHQPAAAALDTDSEAGADAGAPDTGGITPITSPAGATTEKKTLKSES